jgi:hypothetical protein
VKRKAPEQALQQQVAQYLDIVLKPPAFWTAIAHGGGGLMRGKINKGMGMKAGIPDILILSPFRQCWIELKSKKGRLSPAQIEIYQALLAAGCCVGVCRSLDEVRAALLTWQIPTRDAIPTNDSMTCVP